MISINKNIQSEILITTMEEIVPEDSLFRKVDKYIDFTFIYEEVKDLYCEDNGRPSIDPVILFKLVFIQALDGIKSMRQTCKKIKVDAEYRWFLGIPFGEDTPHFSTFSKNYERRFKGSDIFEKIFINIVNQAIKYKLVDGKILYTDSTHKKANANKNKFNDEIKEVVKKRREWLEEEINEERRKQGKKEFEYKDEYEEKDKKVASIFSIIKDESITNHLMKYEPTTRKIIIHLPEEQFGCYENMKNNNNYQELFRVLTKYNTLFFLLKMYYNIFSE